uniref:NADH-ubiquinone oxidoreductase chain 4 n=1 Tax=Laonastes aenigmamus TaxID=340180 RepID=A0A342KAQ7_9HYST|nr:NADH dehydrogenase subunit 4 [Laonastes aenigmamus]ANC48891.1 NADH dehydrogenase subunit 4 [Laonastes aenigmamus]
MLKVIIPTIMLLPLTWFSNAHKVFMNLTTYSLLISLVALISLNQPDDNITFSTTFHSDALSAPLLVLTTWLLPLMIIASQNHMKKELKERKKLYLSLIICLQTLLIMTFLASELMMFYILFEATLIPTLIIITRWGNQAERLNAGTYFLFYTLTGSLPLLIALMYSHKLLGSLNFPWLCMNPPLALLPWSNSLLWLALIMAFMVKMPLYGIHLWLPKAHVEAPIAGSMVLAAILLKLGGYGLMRVSLFTPPPSELMILPFITLSLWGMIMTSSICLRQTDLKSLIAYSSVSHMALVVVAVLIKTPWSYAGATVLMIAHGLTSSLLFCLANTNYERTHSRTMILTRGLKSILPLMTLWWFIASLTNLALPPTINLVGELMIITSSFSWSHTTILLTGLNMLITAIYTLYMLILTQRGKPSYHITKMYPSFTRENALMALHLCPLLLLSANPKLIMGFTC